MFILEYHSLCWLDIGTITFSVSLGLLGSDNLPKSREGEILASSHQNEILDSTVVFRPFISEFLYLKTSAFLFKKT